MPKIAMTECSATRCVHHLSQATAALAAAAGHIAAARENDPDLERTDALYRSLLHDTGQLSMQVRGLKAFRAGGGEGTT